MHLIVMPFAIDLPCRRTTSTALQHSRFDMRGILLWAIGIPIPIIILLYLFHVI
ncbi:MAG TPA: hypothetical protein VKI44_22380 [Acetobacteraceae bacterium]|nr:hypothetical protein [Acetobacteraceae bacterium]